MTQRWRLPAEVRGRQPPQCDWRGVAAVARVLTEVRSVQTGRARRLGIVPGSRPKAGDRCGRDRAAGGRSACAGASPGSPARGHWRGQARTRPVLEPVSVKRQAGRFVTSRNSGAVASHLAGGWHTEPMSWADLSSREGLVGEPSQAVSPIVWKDGQRRKAGFVRAEVFAFDFDRGMTLDEARTEFAAFQGVIYTTKSHRQEKNGVTCDRFRVMLALDRAVTDPAEWDLLQRTLCTLFPMADPSSSRRHMFYWFGPPNCTIIGLEGSRVLRVDSLLARGKHLGLDRPVTRDWEAAKQIVVGDARPDAHLIRQLDQLYRERLAKDADFASKDTFARVFSMLIAAARLRPDPRAVLASFRVWPPCRDWLNRHPNQAASFGRQVARAFAVARSQIVEYRPLEPRNEAVLRRPGSLPALDPELRTMLDRYCLARGIKLTRHIDPTAALLSELAGGSRNAILQARCGEGKSVALTAYAATYARPNRPVWIVKPTLEACRRQREDLRLLGVDCGLLAGFDESQCTRGQSRANWQVLYSRRESPCPSCPDGAECDFAATLDPNRRAGGMRQSVVVLTHARLLDLWEAGELPARALIVIDEDLTRWQDFELSAEDEQRLLQAFSTPVDSPLRSVWQNDLLPVLQRHLQDVRSRVADGSCRADGMVLDESVVSSARRHLAQKREAGLLGNSQSEIARSYLRFFSRAGQRYVMEEGGTLHWRRDRVLLDLPNTFIILSASAALSEAEWPGFTIHVLDLGREFGNVTLHPIPLNPTRRRLAESFSLMEAAVRDEVFEWQATSKCLIATNKESGIPDLQELMDALHTQGRLVHLTRGRILGSNEARECSVLVLAMGVFTRVSDYVLAAAVAEGREFEAKDIWNLDGKHRSPRMTRTGFADPLIDAAFRRRYADELYQTIMRGCARKGDMEPCDVFAVISGWWLLYELDRLMPGLRVADTRSERMNEFQKRAVVEMLAFVQMRDSRELPATGRKAAEAMGYSNADAQTRHRALDQVLALSINPPAA